MIVTYFHFGSRTSPDESDLAGTPAHHGDTATSFPALRAALRRKLAENITDRREALTLLGGDFNYVIEDGDRVSLSTACDSGRRDGGEEGHFQNAVAERHGLFELYQEAHTHMSASARSRLDRLYSNYHASEQLDRRLQVTALEWRHDLSTHRAVLASLRSAIPCEGEDRALPTRAILHKDFPKRLMLEYHEQLHNSIEANPLTKLRLYKKCMRTIAGRLEHDTRSPPPAVDLEDRLGVALRLIRAIEGARPNAVSSCLLRSPELKDLVQNPYDFNCNLTRSLDRLRDYVVQLARERALEELRKSRDDLDDPDGQLAHRVRQKNARLIFRLAPGRASTIGAILEPSGEVTASQEGMAKTLSNHWAKVFQSKGINDALLTEWLQEDSRERSRLGSSPFDPNALHLKRKHLIRALRGSNNSSPGPDGIPFMAWRRCLKFSATILLEAAEFIFTSDVGHIPQADIELLNGSLLFLLPKKPTGFTSEGIEIYEPANTRPLNVANTDNRLLCNAIRLAIEPKVSHRILELQRGFLSGRSMLANLVDMDEGMVSAMCSSDDGAALFFDFAAAFPSIEHEYMMHVFRHLSWPTWLLRFIQVLYSHNTCELAMGGSRHKGFAITRGVRQGCPLSPLLFAVAADVLLRRIQCRVPDGLIRAYADDTALVHKRIWSVLPDIELIFGDFQRISGLALNIDKTVFVPLSNDSLENVREKLIRSTPLWGCMTIARCAKYLGFIVGPGRGDSTWDAPVGKFTSRARLWGGLGLGTLNTILAYRVFVLSTLLFICQLDPLPAQVLEAEVISLRRLFRGPHGWTSPAVLKSLKWLGFPAEIPDLASIAVAAKARVVLLENSQQGGLQIQKRAVQLRRMLSHPDCALRACWYSDWVASNFLFNLDAAALQVHALPRGAGGMAIGGDNHCKQGYQARISAALRPALEVDAQVHLRRRLDRWQVSVLPGHRIQRFRAHMRRLGKLVAPRVQAAVLRTAMNGWSTARRFQGVALCCFGCPQGTDSIEHYAFCNELHALRARFLGLTRPQRDKQLEDFIGLGLTTARSVHAPNGEHEDQFESFRAIAVYTAFRIQAAVRHGAPRTDAPELFRGFLREATRGHPASARAVALAHKRRLG